VLFYAAREAMRNAARHGRDREAARPLHLCVGVAWREPAAGPGQRELEITIEDDGVGLGPAADATGGSGQGLAFHSTMMAVGGGTLAVESVPGAYTRVSLTLPQEAW
jgi:signal transduction histidine kinase